jgi:hypothetical protein
VGVSHRGRRTPGIKQCEWDRDDLIRRVCHALDVARPAVERLGSAGYTDPEEPANNIPPEKVVTETALLLFIASRVAFLDEIGVRIQDVAKQLIPHARSERVLTGICTYPALAFDYAQAHVLLSALGYRDAEFDSLLEHSLVSQAAFGRERPPHRVLEREWIRDIWMTSGKGPRRLCSSMARQSILGHPIDIFNSSRDDGYAFTHVLMYITNLGIHASRLPRARESILAEAEGALAGCLDDQDYDLGGEFLFAWPLTGASWSAAAVFAFRVLARVEDEAGFLPASSTRLDRLKKLEGTERSNYLFATAYHTAFVMGVLCSAALLPGRTPPLRIAARNRIHGIANKILPYVELAPSGPHWQHDFDQLDETERDAIGPLLLAVALRRNIRGRQFRATWDLLKIAYDHHIADSPAASQAAEILERFAAFAAFQRGKSATHSINSAPAPF